MLEILTPMNKIERVTRQIDPDNFVAAPGIWAEVEAAGSIKNVVTDTPALINKLVMGNASSNVYESHDVSIGRITTMESFGVRCKVDSEGYAGTIAQGALLIVSTKTGQEGKLVSVDEETEAAGDYEIVAKTEQVDATAGWIIFKTVSPISYHTAS